MRKGNIVEIHQKQWYLILARILEIFAENKCTAEDAIQILDQASREVRRYSTVKMLDYRAEFNRRIPPL